MATLFEGVSISGIVKPGQVYMLFDATCGDVDGEIDLIYLIRSERELADTLKMEWEIVLGSMYRYRKLVKVEKVEEDRHAFRMLIGEDEQSLIQHCLYLHRIKPYAEMLVKMMETFAVDSTARPGERGYLPKS
jgi:hypothetical protein